MAPNITLPTSDEGGDTIRTVDRSGTETPVSLIDVGGTSSETLLGDSGGFMPLANTVKDGSGTFYAPLVDADGHFQIDVLSSALPSGAATAANQSTGNTALAAIQAAVEGTLTVGSHAVTNAGTFVVQVDGTALTRLTDIETNTDSLAVTGGGLEASALRVTLANDSTGVLSVDDNGGSLTVDGTVTANLGATDNAVLDQIEVNTSYGDNTGGGVESGALRVTLANDSTGLLSVDDNGGALTVDAANDGSLNVQIGDGSNTATIRNLASNDALNVSIVDGSGNQVTSFGGSGGTSATDDSTFTAGSGSGTPMMGFASSDTVDSGDCGVLAMDTSRRLLVSIEADNAGIGGGTQYTEDAAAPANPVGNAMMAERDDALGGLTPAEGDWTHLYCDANGALWVTPSGTVTVDNGGTFVTQIDGTALTRLTDIETNTDYGATTGGGTESGALRVTVASDSTGVLSVDDNGGSLTVDNSGITTIAGAVSGSEMQVDVVAALPAGTNAIGKLAANSGVDIGDVDVTSIAAGSNLIGDVGIQGRTTGGLSTYYDNDLDETEQAVKASAGTLYGIYAINTTDAPIYLQLFNAGTGIVTVGTTTPTMQFVIPGNADSDGAGFSFSLPQGIAFSTAITAAATTNSEGNGAPGANACHVNLFYK